MHWHIAAIISTYIVPVVVFMGTILNMLSIFTFSHSKLRKKPISFLLIILSITDTLTLAIGPAVAWFEYITQSYLTSTNDILLARFMHTYYIL